MKNLFIASLASAAALIAAPTLAAGGGDKAITDYNWSYEGPFGSYDQDQLQRGLQVFTEVCSACHGIKQVGFYTLDDKGGPHLPEDQARAYPKGFMVWDEKLKEEREATYADHFPANDGAGAPDLSLMAKARAGFHGPYGLGINQILKGIGGDEYIYSLLTHYADAEPACAEGVDMGGLNYNASFGGGAYPESCIIYEEHEEEHVLEDGTVEMRTVKHEVGRKVPGSWYSMPNPLSDGLVDYVDGYEGNKDIPETVEQYAADVTAFLMWTAEPNLNARKKMGMVAFVMLSLLTVLLYLSNKALWYNVKHKD